MSQQLVGNVGLFYASYRLSRLGWNVLPTMRNAKGVDVLMYSQDGRRRLTIQVKSLSKREAVALGGKLSHYSLADFWIVCRHVLSGNPECFILTAHEVGALARKNVNGKGEVSYWLEPPQYEAAEYRERWDRIGSGADDTNSPASLDDLLASVTDQNLHDEVDLGAPVGREGW